LSFGFQIICVILGGTGATKVLAKVRREAARGSCRRHCPITDRESLRGSLAGGGVAGIRFHGCQGLAGQGVPGAGEVAQEPERRVWGSMVRGWGGYFPWRTKRSAQFTLGLGA